MGGLTCLTFSITKDLTAKPTAASVKGPKNRPLDRRLSEILSDRDPSGSSVPSPGEFNPRSDRGRAPMCMPPPDHGLVRWTCAPRHRDGCAVRPGRTHAPLVRAGARAVHRWDEHKSLRGPVLWLTGGHGEVRTLDPGDAFDLAI
jgi:hypothetical protein